METTSRRSILVIDDSLTTRMMEQSILEAAGYAVDLAVSADEALARDDLARFKLIVCDVEMIRMDQINSAYERMLKSDVKYRFVIDMQTLRDASASA